MATNPNMVAIQTVTVSATSAANIEFTNIPQGYTDLVVKYSLRQTGYTGVTWDWLKFRFNGSSSTVYSSRDLEGNGANTYSNTFTSQNGMRTLGLANSPTSTSNTFSNGELYIPNYTSSNNKSVSGDGVHEDNATNAITVLGAGLWADTSAITSITLFPENGTAWVQHSSATLYGVTSAGAGAKATGGIVTSDANYYYHTFLNSGTFTPTQSLTADYLVVAGGGGAGSGGQARVGGGGAGGYRTSIGGSALSLTAQAYTVTVGAGGSSSASGSNSVFSTITSSGGGGGGDNSATPNGDNGGSGGGGSANGASSSTGTGGTGNAGSYSPVEGYAGGTGRHVSGSYMQGGGGGGSAGVGGSINSVSDIGAGGAGTANSISGTSVTYAAGGGGSGTNNYLSPGTPGTANTGNGGAGADGSDNGRAGGSGIVIVRYAK